MKKIPKALESFAEEILDAADNHIETGQPPSDCEACNEIVLNALVLAYEKGKRAGERKRKK